MVIAQYKQIIRKYVTSGSIIEITNYSIIHPYNRKSIDITLLTQIIRKCVMISFRITIIFYKYLQEYFL